MFTQKQLNSVSPEVAAALRDLNREESLSNLNQAKIGKRVDLTRHLEKIIGCECTLCTTETGEETVQISDPIIAPKERIPYLTGKEPNRYKVREVS